MADVIQLRSTTFVEGHAWWPSYATGLRNSTIYLGRNRWTAGDPVLEAVDCEPGAQWVHSVDRRLRVFRQDGRGTADDTARMALATTFGATLHPDDYGDSLPSFPIAAHGDLGIGDFNDAGDRFLWGCDDTRGWYTLSARAQYRDAATSGAPIQDSDRIELLASSWDASDSVARGRSFFLRSEAVSAVDSSDQWRLTFSYQAEESSEEDFLYLWSGHGTSIPTAQWMYPTGGQVQFLFGARPGQTPTSGAVATVAVTGGESDGVEMNFGHLGPNKRAHWRYYHGQGRNDLGSAAELLSVNHSKDADVSVTMRHSGAFGHRMSYYDGAAHTVGFYAQGQLDSTTPTGRWRLGSDFGDGTLDFDQDGNLTLSGTPASGGGDFNDSPILTLMGSYDDGGATPGGFRLTTVMDSATPTAHLRVSTSMGDGTLDLNELGGVTLGHTDDPRGSSLLTMPTVSATAMANVNSLLITQTGKAWDGAASVDRGWTYGVLVNDPDDYEWCLLNNNFDFVSTWTPWGYQSLAGTLALSGDVVDAHVAAISLAPTFDGAHAVTSQNYILFRDPTLSGGATLTRAACFEFDQNAGTHKALASGTTKTTPGGVDAWMIVNVNGTPMYLPLYTSKTA